MKEVTAEDLQRLVTTIRESSRVKYGTHYTDCHFEHHGCAALALAAALSREREARERAEGEALILGDTLRQIWGPHKGCADHSCVCGRPEGQATNGGCRCEANHLRRLVAELRVKARGALVMFDKFKG